MSIQGQVVSGLYPTDWGGVRFCSNSLRFSKSRFSIQLLCNLQYPVDLDQRIPAPLSGTRGFQINRLEEEEKNLSRRSQGFRRTPARSLCAVLKGIYLEKTCDQSIPHRKLRKSTEKDLFTVFLPSSSLKPGVFGRFLPYSYVQLRNVTFQMFKYEIDSASILKLYPS